MSIPWLYRVGPLVGAINPAIARFEFEVATPVLVGSDFRDDCEYLPKLRGQWDEHGEYVRVTIGQADRIAAAGGDLLDEQLLRLHGDSQDRLGNADAWSVQVKPMVRIEGLYDADEDEGTAS